MKGIVPSLNTPFLEDETVDHKSLRRLVHHSVDAGCGGMLGLAVAGEYATLTLEEKIQYVETVTDANSGRIPFIVSVTSPDIGDSLELTKVARSVGAAGICVQLPDKLDRAGKLDLLKDLAQHGPNVVMVQDLDWSGGGLDLDDIVYLAKNVQKFTWLKIETQQAGIKYSSVLRATGTRLNVCGGWAVTQLMDAMARGVQAFIPTGMERVYIAIYSLYTSGRTVEARALFERLLPILNFSNQHVDVSIRFFKGLRKAEGLFESDTCRMAAELDPIQQHEAKHALASALVLTDELGATKMS